MAADRIAVPMKAPGLPRVPEPASLGDVLREQLDYLLEYQHQLSAADQERMRRVTSALLDPFVEAVPAWRANRDKDAIAKSRRIKKAA